MQKLQRWYPNPPLVLFVSNNEAAKLAWWEVETSKRYVDLYGLGKDDNFKRQVVGDAWVPRYRALQSGLSAGLIQRKWTRNAKFVGFEAFGPVCLGRWPDWIRNSLYNPGRVEPWPLAWDGASSGFYVFDTCGITDCQVYSPEIESMNSIFMLKDAYRLNPGFWFELSTWDGGKTKHDYFASLGQTYNPDRYGGMVQFGMWLLRPRLVREYRGYNETVADYGPYFLAVTGAVDSVHRDPLLRKFWRKADLVANRAGKHPVSNRYPARIPGSQQMVSA